MNVKDKDSFYCRRVSPSVTTALAPLIWFFPPRAGAPVLDVDEVGMIAKPRFDIVLPPVGPPQTALWPTALLVGPEKLSTFFILFIP